MINLVFPKGTPTEIKNKPWLGNETKSLSTCKITEEGTIYKDSRMKRPFKKQTNYSMYDKQYIFKKIIKRYWKKEGNPTRYWDRFNNINKIVYSMIMQTIFIMSVEKAIRQRNNKTQINQNSSRASYGNRKNIIERLNENKKKVFKVAPRGTNNWAN